MEEQFLKLSLGPDVVSFSKTEITTHANVLI